jgi:hypothetical protein
MNKETAREVERLMRQATYHLDESVRIVLENCDQEELHGYRRSIGRIMGEIYLEIMCPIYEQYDDLMPDELRSVK